MKIILIIIGLLVLREVMAYIFGWSADWFGVADAIETRKHNAKIRSQFGKNIRPDDIIATDYMDAIQKSGREGFTIEGDVYKTMTHVGKNRWRAGVEEFRK